MALQNFTIEYGVTVGNANITGSSGNINTSGYVNANFITVGNTISVTGNANAGNVGAAAGVFTGNISAGNLVVNGKSNLGAVGNVTITGGSNGQYIQTDGNGNISWSTISTTSISNGNSNVVVAANGNVSISSAGTANVLVVTSTGANVAGTLNVTGNANLGNIGVTNAVVSANATFGNINSVSGILSVSGNANVGNLSTGIAVITANTVSTSTTSGALKVTGGVGIAGNLNAGNATASHIITGNVTITGNITVSGDQTIIGTTNTFFTDNIIELHDLANGTDPWVTDDGRDVGIRVHYYKGGDNHAFFGWANDSQSMEYYYQATETSGVISGSYGTFKGNIFNSTATTGTAPFIVNSTTQVANLNAAFSGTVTSNSQPNITSVGTLGSLSVTGNVNVGNIGATSIVGTLTTASQTNITSVGTLGSLSVTGNITGGNLIGTHASGNSNITITANGNVSITSAGTANVLVVTSTGANITGTLYSSGNVGIGTTSPAARLHIVAPDQGYSAIFDGGANGNYTKWANAGSAYAYVGSGNELFGGLSTDFGIRGETTITLGIVTSEKMRITSTGNVGIGNTNPLNTLSVTGTMYVSGNANVGNIGATSIVGTLTTASQTNITSVGTLGSLSVTGNVSAGNISATSIVGTLTTASQTNMTSVGTLGTLSVTGNITGGNFIGTHACGNSNVAIAANGNICITSAGTANVLVVTGTGANIAGTLNATGNANVGNIGTVSGVFSGNVGIGPSVDAAGADGVLKVRQILDGAPALTIDTNATGGSLALQVYDYKLGAWRGGIGHGSTAITGTAVSDFGVTSDNGNLVFGTNYTEKMRIVNSSGNVGIGNTNPLNTLSVTGTIYASGNANVGNIGATNANLTAMTVSGNANVGNIGATNAVITANATFGNISSVSGILSVSGNITGGNLIGTLASGNSNVAIAANGNISITSAGIANVLVVTSTGANIAGTLNATGNVNVGNIGAAAAVFTNTAKVGNTLTVNTSNIATAIANGGTAGTGNIGAAGQGFDTLYARQASANYADLAEIYSSDDVYEYGTVVVFGGDQEITISTVSHDSRVAGVISQQPAFLMNDTASGLPVALTGRVPCRVLGPVTKGALLTSSNIAGVAMVLTADQYVPGCVLGKSLEDNHNGGTLIIEAVVGRM